MRWTYKRVSLQPGVKGDPAVLEVYLKEGWEPYAVTWDGRVFDHHLRMRVPVL